MSDRVIFHISDDIGDVAVDIGDENDTHRIYIAIIEQCDGCFYFLKYEEINEVLTDKKALEYAKEQAIRRCTHGVSEEGFYLNPEIIKRIYWPSSCGKGKDSKMSAPDPIIDDLLTGYYG